MFLSGMVFSFVAFNGCADFKLGPEGRGARIKGGKESLVQRDVTGNRPIWCGPGRTELVYVVDDVGIFRYDIETGKRVQITGWGDWPVACTPDGEWFIYREGGSYRADKGDPEHRVVVDLWRYELATGKRQRFAIADDEGVGSFNEAVYSSEGLKFYLGGRPGESIEMPEPVWEVVWSEKNKLGESIWFSDSSAVITSYWGRQDGDYDIVAEVLKPERKTVVFNPEEISNFFLLLADSQNRLYMRVDDEGADSRIVERCDIDLEKEELSCQTVLELPRGAPAPDRLCPECPTFPLATGPSVEGFDLFGDGETMAYTTTRDRCVRLMRIGEEEGECLTTSDYRGVGHVVISPDERWVAFTVDRKIGEDGPFDIVEGDLYIIEIRKK
jgi:hypothetical protein